MQIKKLSLTLYIGFIIFIASGHKTVHAMESTLPYSQTPGYQKADEVFSAFSTEYYHHLDGRQQAQDYRSFHLIIAEAKHAYYANRITYAIGLIMGHLHLLNNNLNSKGIIEAEELLLDANEYNTAAHYLEIINNESDPSIIANIQYAFAEYYYKRNRWNKTIQVIEKIANDLPPPKYHHAMLMLGIALQNTKKQRRALEVYKKIPENSGDYVAARINMAVANMRQGWWTDTYIILKKLLKRPDVIRNKALSDRIHTVIGYTFLQQEYYRNSRNAFRSVELKGPYTNQALLGIALDASYQKDYVGALNAAQILQQKNSGDLQVDEANLLLPYFYEKLGQMATASAGYSDAISYFKNRLRALNAILKMDRTQIQTQAISDSNILTINDERINLAQQLPVAFFNQYKLLKQYKVHVEKSQSSTLALKYNSVLQDFNNLIYLSVKNSVALKIKYLTDYMNQSRYGLARLYDKNLSDAE